jgi:hypothetical protein
MRRVVTAQAPSYVLIGDLLSQLCIEVADSSREQDEMHEQDEMQPSQKKAKERQVDTEERQSDEAFPPFTFVDSVEEIVS